MRKPQKNSLYSYKMDKEQEYYQKLVQGRSLRRMEFAKKIASDYSAEKEAQSKAYKGYKDTAQTLQRVVAGPKYKAPVEAITLGFRLRQELKQGEGYVLVIALAFAFAIDFIDLVPVAGWMVNWFFKPALFFMLWGYGTWKLKLTRAVLIIFDLVPFVSVLPMSVVSVVYTYHVIKKREKEARQELEELREVFGEV